MKKRISVLLSVLLLCTVAFGCGGRSKPGVVGDDVYVTVIDKGLGSEWIKAAATAYYEETGITVKTAADPFLVGSCETAMNSSGEKEDLYFVAQGSSNWAKWINRNYIADITSVLDSTLYGTSARERCIDAYGLSTGAKDGKNYLVPYVYTNWGIAYNKELLQKIESRGEYKKGEFPATVQGLLDLAAATKAANLKSSRTGNTVKPFACDLVNDYMKYFFFNLWGQLDKTGFDAYWSQNDRSGYKSELLNTPAVKTALEAVFDVIGAESSTNSNLVSSSQDNYDSQTSFLNGDCVAVFTGSWFESEMSQTLSERDITVGYAGFPKVNGQTEAALSVNFPGEYFFIPSSAQNVAGAKDFLAFLMSEKCVAKVAKTLNQPLLFSTDQNVAYSAFGQDVANAVQTPQKLYAYSDADVFSSGALWLFRNTTNPFSAMAKYSIKDKADIQSKVIDSEVRFHTGTNWDDFMKNI